MCEVDVRKQNLNNLSHQFRVGTMQTLLQSRFIRRESARLTVLKVQHVQYTFETSGPKRNAIEAHRHTNGGVPFVMVLQKSTVRDRGQHGPRMYRQQGEHDQYCDAKFPV